MTGKISNAEKNYKIGSKLNSNMVKISSSKSILSYQNGSAPNVESRVCTTEEGMPVEGPGEDAAEGSEDPLGETENLKSECLDLLRKKLISDLSLTVFSCDLENKLTKMEPVEISKERQSVVQKLVVQISQLSDAERLLLYLKLPSSTSSPFDPLRQ
ncbi:hypothetical protein RUM43_011903 [Polyplax serrata]|uniref:Uncharacterized protein n=1 Tax=Polyplax serrata TaxID=468196 RepID=A0AAN8P609_POLSC